MSALARAFLRTSAQAFYRGDASARLPILMYHRVLAAPDALQREVPDAALLHAQMRVISQVFNVLPLDEAVARLGERRLPPRAIAITFDDGYRDNHDVAMPILREFGLTATFFVCTGFLDGGRMFNDTVAECVRRLPATTLELPRYGVDRCEVSDVASRIAAIDRIVRAVKYQSNELRDELCRELEARVGEPLPDTLMMTTEQVRSLVHHGMSVGGHTVNHSILRSVDDATARAEIERNRDELHALTGARPRCFAYPNGKPGADYRAVHVGMVREAGFQAALSTAYALPGPDTDPFQLPRFVPKERSATALVARMIRMLRYIRPALA